MSAQPSRITCIGGATLDRKFRTAVAARLGTSNPVSSERAFGGVARNVAENLARLGVAATLVTAVGEDEGGVAIRAHLDEIGIETRHLVRSSHRSTAEYVAVLQPEGELVIGLADMAVFDELTPAVLHELWKDIEASQVFADCNLPAETLSELLSLARRSGTPVSVDAVSTLKVTRLPDDLTGLDILFLNLDEARALVACPEGQPENLAAALRARGAARVVLTDGPAGLLLASDAGFISMQALSAETCDATGAGDALIAGTLAALWSGRRLVEALRLGIAAATLTLESAMSVRQDLSFALLEDTLLTRASRPSVGTR